MHLYLIYLQIWLHFQEANNYCDAFTYKAIESLVYCLLSSHNSIKAANVMYKNKLSYIAHFRDLKRKHKKYKACPFNLFGRRILMKQFLQI